MSWIARFFILVLFLSFAELKILIYVAQNISFWGTMGLCMLTGLIGGALVRRQGISTLAQIKASLSQGKIPAVELLSGLMLFACGLLMLTPGFITDSLGFLMLIPPLRRQVAAALSRYFSGKIIVGSNNAGFRASSFGDFRNPPHASGAPPQRPSTWSRNTPNQGVIIDVEAKEPDAN